MILLTANTKKGKKKSVKDTR